MYRTWPCWTLVLILTGLWLMSHGKVAEAGEPQELIRQTLTGLLAVLTDETLKPPEQRQERLRRIAQVVSPSFDFKEMARRSLGRDWHRLTSTQQEEFVQLFQPSALAIIGETHCLSGYDQYRRLWECPECRPVYTRNHRPGWRCVGTNSHDVSP